MCERGFQSRAAVVARSPRRPDRASPRPLPRVHRAVVPAACQAEKRMLRPSGGLTGVVQTALLPRVGR